MNRVKPRLPSARRFTGSSLNSAPLLQLLAGLGVAEPAAPALSFAERWSPWLAWTDAITLSAVLGHGAPASAARPHPAAGAAALAGELKRVRQDLAQAIGSDLVLTAGSAGKSAAALDRPPLDETDLASLHRQYQAHQRAMDEHIAPLRAQVRAALTGQGGDLARLAALDAVLDQALAARQRRLLATVPGWLDKHFKRAPAALPEAAALQQRMLQAELDLRLQPVEAMIDALAQAAGKPADQLRHPAAVTPTKMLARGRA